MIADGELKELDPRFVAAESVSWWIGIGIVALVMVVLLAVDLLAGLISSWLVRGGIMLTCALVVAVLCWLANVQPRWVYDRYRYRVGELGIEIRKGIIWRRVITVPRSRVQHTDVSQGPLIRRYGLAMLTIHTAGTENSTVTLVGVSHGTALRIRDFLIRGGQRDGV